MFFKIKTTFNRTFLVLCLDMKVIGVSLKYKKRKNKHYENYRRSRKTRNAQ